MCMVDYGEGWKVFRDEHRTARKEHKCCECSRAIVPGERYYFATGISNDSWLPHKWDVFHMCPHCEWAASWLMVECNGYLFHGVYEDLLEHWQEEPLLRSPDLGRRIILMRRRWRDRSGNLIPVPV